MSAETGEDLGYRGAFSLDLRTCLSSGSRCLTVLMALTLCPVGKSARSAALSTRQPDVAGGHCNTLQCSVVTAVMAFVAERGTSNTGGPEGKLAVWFETLAQLAPLPLLSRTVGVGVGLC